MSSYPLGFTLHKHCREMLGTYQRDDGLHQNALGSYVRCLKLQTRIQNSYTDQKTRATAGKTEPAPKIVEDPASAAPSPDTGAEIIPLPLRPIIDEHVSFHVLPTHVPEADNVVRVAFG